MKYQLQFSLLLLALFLLNSCEQPNSNTQQKEISITRDSIPFEVSTANNILFNAHQFCFDKICTDNIPVQLISTPNPARFKIHFLGNEFLKRFNTVFDFQNDYVYLKPNSLISLPYADAS